MQKIMKNEIIKKLLSVSLALVVAVTFIPLLGDAAFAEGEDETLPDTTVEEALTDDGVDSPDSVTTENDTITEVTPAEDSSNVEVDPAEATSEEDAVSDEIKSLSDVDLSNDMQSGETASTDTVKAKSTVDNRYFSFSVTRKGRTVYINGAFKSAYSTRYFGKLYIDGNYIGDFSSYKYNKLENLYFNLDSVNSVFASTGFHSVIVNTHTSSGTKQGDATGTYRVGINAAPSANGSIAVYHNYLDYMSPVDGNLINYRLFLEYNGRVYGPMSYLQSAKITGLAPNSNYGIISYYGVYKDGTWFTGKEEGRYRSLGTYRTGVGTTPKIKSIKVKATKVKKKTQKVYGYYTGLYLGKRKYYKYSIKITVKLKKAPGTNGIWINGKKFKGNKKKYTVKLGPYTNYSKPKGKKFTVMIYSYYNNSYGGYSPMYRTVKKVK